MFDKLIHVLKENILEKNIFKNLKCDLLWLTFIRWANFMKIVL